MTTPPRSGKIDVRPWYRKKRFAIPLGIFGVLVLLTVIGIVTDPGDGELTSDTQAIQPTTAETITEVVTETVTESPDAERAAELDEREAALDDRAAQLDEREEQLDRRARRLNRRERRIAGAEAEQAANTFTDGIYVVGRDIEPGTYQTGGEGSTIGACYVATLDDSGDLMDNDIGEGQRVFTVGSDAARVEFSGGCEWTRQ